MIYLQIFWSFFKVGLFSIGGGYASMPLIQHQVVDLHEWLTMKEFADVVTMSQMTPGPIALNSATFVGTKVAGFQGAIIATIGCVTPSCIIVLILASMYLKFRHLSVVKGILNGLKAAVTALIASAGYSLVILSFWGEKEVNNTIKNIDVVAVILFVSAFFVLRKWKLSPIIVLIGAGILGVLIYSFI